MLKATGLAVGLLLAAPALAQVPPAGEALEEAQPAEAPEEAQPAADFEQAEPAEPFEEAGAASGSGLDVGVEASFLSDYRFRGVSRSAEDPAGQIAINLSHGSGVYAGARGTTLAGTDPFRRRDPAFQDLGDVQLDLYAGYGARLGDGFELDAGLLYYVFAGGDGATDYVEPYASLSYLIGPVYATAGAKYAPSQQAIGDEDMLYLFGQVDVTIPFRPWSLSATLGHQDWGRYGGYWTWSIGVEHQLRIEGLPNAEIGVSYVDTSLPSIRGQDAALVLRVGVGF